MMHVQEKSPQRIAVEAVLETATALNPLSITQIAERAGVGADVTRKLVHAACTMSRAYNLNAGKKGSPGLYARGVPPKIEIERMPTQRQVVTTGGYTGERPIATRPGAMDAYAIPSLGESERRRPMIIGAGPRSYSARME
jgi:hypothetical protein